MGFEALMRRVEEPVATGDSPNEEGEESSRGDSMAPTFQEMPLPEARSDALLPLTDILDITADAGTYTHKREEEKPTSEHQEPAAIVHTHVLTSSERKTGIDSKYAPTFTLEPGMRERGEERPPGTLHLSRGDYRVGKCLGKGGEGTVYVARPHTNDETLAMVLGATRQLYAQEEGHDIPQEPYARFVAKVLPAGNLMKAVEDAKPLHEQEESQRALHQKRLQSHLGFLVDSGQVVDYDQVYRVLIFDRAPGKTLATWKKEWHDIDGEKPHRAEHTLRIVVAMRSIAGILRDHFERGWVHADVKPANVMVDMDYPFLSRPIDFGIAHRVEHARERGGKSSGTPHYMTQEDIAAVNAKEGVEMWRDIYGLGLSFGEAIGLFSFVKTEGDNPLNIMHRQGAGEWVSSPRVEGEQGMEGTELDTHSRLFAVGEQGRGMKAFIELLYRMVRPHDKAPERRAKWEAWGEHGEPMSWQGVEKELGKVIELLEGEVLAQDGELPLTQEELEAMRRDMEGRLGRAKNRVYAQWRILEGGEHIPEEQRQNIEQAMRRVRDGQDVVTQLERCEEVLALMAPFQEQREPRKRAA